MSQVVLQRFFACALVLCLLVIGGVASAQTFSHESQHSHHQKATHSTVLCSWMCAAGQVLDLSAAPSMADSALVALVEPFEPQTPSLPSLLSIPSRGPPVSALR